MIAPRRSGKQQRHIDFVLLTLVATLLALGVVSVYSASYADAQRLWGDGSYLFTRQVIWAVLGLIAMVTVVTIDYGVWRRFVIPVMAVALVGLVVVLVLSEERFGALRNLLNGSIQPSEMAKLAVIMYIASWLSSRKKTLRDVRLGLVPFAVLLGIITVLIVAEPNFSTAILVVIIAMVMFFIAGADLKQLGIATGIVAITFAVIISQSDYARARVQDYLAFVRDPMRGGSDHARMAVMLLAQGGLTGRGGPGASQLDPDTYIPVGWSDAILAIVGRDTGLIGTLFVVGLFAGLMYRGFRIALHADDNFGTLLASGITFWLVFQAIINIGVITAVIPFTGMPLPFISYGGSSLVAAMTGIGLLLSVSRGTRQPEEKGAGSAFGRGNRRPRLSQLSDRSRPAGRHPARRRGRSRVSRT